MDTTEIHSTTLPRIGDKAPEFKAITTQGDINFHQIIKAVGLSSSAILLTSLPSVPLNL